MKKALSLVLALSMAMLLLAGCGGDSSESKGKLYVYSFGDYIDPVLVDEFEAETGYEVILDTFDTNEEMYPVIKNQSVEYDVICASDYMIEKMNKEDLLGELDYSLIPNSENISDNIKPFFEDFDPGMKHSIPHTWGTYGLLYNTEMVEGDMDSWDVLWDEKNKDQIVLPDSVRECFVIAAKKLGYSANTVDPKEVSEITELLLKQKPLVYKYANDSARDLIIGESAAIAVTNSGEYYYSKEQNDKIEYVVPKEGTEVWVDCWALTKNAKNKEAAMAWMNFMLDGETAETNFEYLTYGIPNKLVEELTDNPVLNPSKEILDRCETLKDLGPDGDKLYSDSWKKVKS